MPLEPKTQEIWCGVRRIDSLVSELREEVDQLKSNLSGFDAYKEQLRNISEVETGFFQLEDALKLRVEDVPDRDEDGITDFINKLITEFNDDFAAYKGDSNSGALSRGTFDEYRTFLTSSGYTSVESDEHIQLLKDLFDPDATFNEDVGQNGSFEEFRKELENNGVAPDTAERVVDLLSDVFPTIGAFDRLVLQSESYDAVKTGLTNAGLTDSEAQDVIDAIKQVFGNSLGESERDQFSEFDSFAEFEDYLLNDVGLSGDRADTFLKKVKNEFNNFDEFRKRLAETESLEELLAEFNHSSQSGSQDIAAGVKVFEESGTDLDGTAMPKGAVSIRGRGKINNVGLDAGQVEQEEESRGPLKWSGLQVGDTTVTAGEGTRISATVENTSNRIALVNARALANGQALASRSVRVDPGATERVVFTPLFPDTGLFDVRVEDTGTTEVRVIPPAGRTQP